MNGKKLLRGTILTALCMAAMLYVNGTVSKAYWVVVKSNGTRVRNTASTEGDNVMTSVNAGDKLDVVSELQGDDGKTWYKVAINNVSGYVRADTVEKAAEGDAAAAPAATVTPTTTAASNSVVEPMASQAATVKTDNVNVRASASTGGNVVAKLQKGAAVTLTGTTKDNSGKTWYQVNFINNGSNVTGFIREDFVEPGEVMEPQTPEEEAPESAGDADPADAAGIPQTENNEFELFFEPDTEGVDCWYIHDNIAQKRYKLEQLMQASEMNTNNIAVKDKEIKRLKIVLLILAVILAAALAAGGFFGYKYFSADDDDDDDDDDIRRAPSVRRSERTGAEAADRRREVPRREERSARESVRRTGDAPQRRPANGQKRPEGEGARVRSAQPARAKSEEETQRKPSGGDARVRNAQSAGGEGRVRSAQSSNAPRQRSAQPGTPARKPQTPPESDAARRGSRPDVEWKSKNFLADNEDELDFSFINGNEEDV